MDYKVVKYKKKKKCPFETYEPERKIRIRRETTIPLMISSGHRFSSVGGLMGFWASSFLLMIKGFFHAEESVKRGINRMQIHKKVVELKIKNKAIFITYL